MGLDLMNTDPAYIAGRVYGICHKMADETGTNAVNRYADLAPASPAKYLPIVIKVAHEQLPALRANKPARAAVYEDVLGKVMGELPTIPEALTADGRSAFILGWYHQVAAMRKPGRPVGTTKPVEERAIGGEITLTVDDWKALEQIGGGNKSEGVRRLLHPERSTETR